MDLVDQESVVSALGDASARLPGLVLETERPTTIGLGDSFAGGFVSALARTT